MSIAVDISPIVQALVGVAATAIPVLGALIYKEVLKYCKIGNDTATAQRVQHGVDAISDIALAYLKRAAEMQETVSVGGVVAQALQTSSVGLAAAAARQGTTPEQMAARVTGALIAKASAAPPVKVAGATPNA